MVSHYIAGKQCTPLLGDDKILHTKVPGFIQLWQYFSKQSFACQAVRYILLSTTKLFLEIGFNISNLFDFNDCIHGLFPAVLCSNRVWINLPPVKNRCGIVPFSIFRWWHILLLCWFTHVRASLSLVPIRIYLPRFQSGTVQNKSRSCAYQHSPGRDSYAQDRTEWHFLRGW